MAAAINTDKGHVVITDKKTGAGHYVPAPEDASPLPRSYYDSIEAAKKGKKPPKDIPYDGAGIKNTLREAKRPHGGK